MSGSHVCFSCRQRIARVHPPKFAQWKPRASFISLSGPKPGAQAQVNDSLRQDILGLGNSVADRKGRKAAIFPEPVKRRPQRKQGNKADELEALFADAARTPGTTPTRETSTRSAVIQNLTLEEAVEPDSRSPISSRNRHLQPYRSVEQLKVMLGQPNRTVEAWEYFLKSFGHVSHPAVGRWSTYLQTASNHMATRLNIAKLHDPLSLALPTAAEFSQVYLKMGMLSGFVWTDMMLTVIESIILKRSESPRNYSQEETLIRELLASWNVVCRPFDRLEYQQPKGSILDWEHLPHISSVDLEKVHKKYGSLLRFGLLTPTFRVKELSNVSLVALATFDILTNDEFDPSDSLSAEMKDFKDLLCRVVAIHDFDLTALGSITKPQNYNDKVGLYVRKRFEDIRSKAILLCPDAASEKKEQRFSRNEGHTLGLSTISKRVSDATSDHDIGALETLWQDVLMWPVLSDIQKDKPRGTMSQVICHLFLSAFMTVRQPDKAIDVWNHMIKCGFKPTLRTWESMMSGCKAARLHTGLEDVWRKMRAENVQPDGQIWTTRIGGLLECRQFDLGLRALDEMGRAWLAAAKLQHPKKSLPELLLLGDMPTAAKPCTATINAALHALLSHKNSQLAREIFAWGKKLGIAPDVITYNTLINHFTKNGKIDEAMTVLLEMTAAGVKADIYTFTTILDITFRAAGEMTSEEQSELVENTFQRMDDAGVTPNRYTYSKIIFELLKTANGDLTVVNAVLARMGKANMEPSPHIFTTLLEHYFSQSPPDLDLIRSLIRRASTVVGSSDNIFWDRVIESYARVGETGAALRVLAKMSTKKTYASYRTLNTLIVALMVNGEEGLAKTVVRDVVGDTGGPIADDVRGVSGQHDFWKKCRDLGLLGVDVLRDGLARRGVGRGGQADGVVASMGEGEGEGE